jgi:hypothetical protein
MSTKKISIVLATMLAMGMMLCSIASAEDNQTLAVYFEIPITGNGIIYERDNESDTTLPFIVEKHQIEKGAKLYIEIDRTEDDQNVSQVVYDASDNATNKWRLMDDYGCAKVTEDGYIVQLTNYDREVETVKRGIYIEEDGIGIKAKVLAQVTLKEKEGKETKGKLKQLGGTYWGCSDPSEGEPHIKKAGALKVKGKLVLFADLPEDVQDLFDAPVK